MVRGPGCATCRIAARWPSGWGFRGQGVGGRKQPSWRALLADPRFRAHDNSLRWGLDAVTGRDTLWPPVTAEPCRRRLWSDIGSPFLLSFPVRAPPMGQGRGGEKLGLMVASRHAHRSEGCTPTLWAPKMD